MALNLMQELENLIPPAMRGNWDATPITLALPTTGDAVLPAWMSSVSGDPHNWSGTVGEYFGRQVHEAEMYLQIEKGVQNSAMYNLRQSLQQKVSDQVLDMHDAMMGGQSNIMTNASAATRAAQHDQIRRAHLQDTLKKLQSLFADNIEKASNFAVQETNRKNNKTN